MPEIREEIKLKKSDISGILKIVEAGGIVKASDWVNDACFKLPIPMFCVEEPNDSTFSATDDALISNVSIAAFHQNNPRVKKRIRFVGNRDLFNKIRNGEPIFHYMNKTEEELIAEENARIEQAELKKMIRSSPIPFVEDIRKNYSYCGNKKSRNPFLIDYIKYESSLKIFHFSQLKFFSNLKDISIRDHFFDINYYLNHDKKNFKMKDFYSELDFNGVEELERLETISIVFSNMFLLNLSSLKNLNSLKISIVGGYSYSITNLSVLSNLENLIFSDNAHSKDLRKELEDLNEYRILRHIADLNNLTLDDKKVLVIV